MVSFFTGNLNLRVWIDWNGDYDFNDAGETAISDLVNCTGVTVGNPTSTASFTFIVPANAPIGVTRMRVYEDMMPADGHEIPTPCGYNTGLGQHGESEDYKVQVTNATGIEMVSTNETISVYPNPASDKIYLSGIGAFNLVEFSVFNAIGEQVIHIEKGYAEPIHSIDLGGISNGIYSIIIRDKNQQTIKTFHLIKK
jgi:hypothetical protein